MADGETEKKIEIYKGLSGEVVFDVDAEGGNTMGDAHADCASFWCNATKHHDAYA